MAGEGLEGALAERGDVKALHGALAERYSPEEIATFRSNLVKLSVLKQNDPKVMAQVHKAMSMLPPAPENAGPAGRRAERMNVDRAPDDQALGIASPPIRGEGPGLVGRVLSELDPGGKARPGLPADYKYNAADANNPFAHDPVARTITNGVMAGGLGTLAGAPIAALGTVGRLAAPVVEGTTAGAAASAIEGHNPLVGGATGAALSLVPFLGQVARAVQRGPGAAIEDDLALGGAFPTAANGAEGGVLDTAAYKALPSGETGTIQMAERARDIIRDDVQRRAAETAAAAEKAAAQAAAVERAGRYDVGPQSAQQFAAGIVGKRTAADAGAAAKNAARVDDILAGQRTAGPIDAAQERLAAARLAGAGRDPAMRSQLNEIGGMDPMYGDLVNALITRNAANRLKFGLHNRAEDVILSRPSSLASLGFNAAIGNAEAAGLRLALGSPGLRLAEIADLGAGAGVLGSKAGGVAEDFLKDRAARIAAEQAAAEKKTRDEKSRNEKRREGE